MHGISRVVPVCYVLFLIYSLELIVKSVLRKKLNMRSTHSA